MPIRSDDEIEEAVRALAEKPNGGLVGLNDSFNIEHRNMIIEAANLADAEAFSAADPYRQAGLFERVEIRPWRHTAGLGISQAT